MRTGITGGDSFIGRALSARLRKEGMEYQWFDGDITQPEHVRRFMGSCDAIFHLAGQNRGDEQEVYRTNALGGRNVASAAHELGGRHVVFPSSIHAENDGTSAYALSKLETEQALLRIAGDRGCRVTIFRLPNVYGRGALPFYVSVVATFCFLKAVGQVEHLPIHGDGSQSVELISVDDVTDRFLGALAQESPAELVRLEGETISILELAEIVRDDARLSGFPAMAEMVQTFAELPHGITVEDGRGLRPLAEERLKEGTLSVMTISDEYSHPAWNAPARKDWIMPIDGRIIVDVYAGEDRYLTSRILESDPAMKMGIEHPYKYVVRGLGGESVAGILRTE